MKFSGVDLNVNGEKVCSLELTYDQLVWLYNDYVERTGKIPTTKDCSLKNNLPQQRIVNKILKSQNITYKDFMLLFGKHAHVRASVDDYNEYVNKFKEISNRIGRALTSPELIDNIYGLPNAQWFAKYCPANDVKSYDDFVRWCGLKSNKSKKDKEDVSKKLLELEKTIGRPLTRDDISYDKVGFSMIVINRIWGSLTKCKKELGLVETPPSSTPKSFGKYKADLDKVIESFKSQTDRKYITWSDIENNNVGINIEHKTITKAFKREGINIKLYLESMGLTMNKSSFSLQHVFDDGEKTLSSMEYDLSFYLKNGLGLIYDVDYKRDVMYKTFTNYDKKSKLNCDYVIFVGDIAHYIEVAGIINKYNWDSIDYGTKIKNGYRDKMIKKRKILEDNGLKYLFLFPEDFKGGQYKNMISDFLGK